VAAAEEDVTAAAAARRHLSRLGDSGEASTASSSASSAESLALLVREALSGPLFAAAVATRGVGLRPTGNAAAAEAGTRARLAARAAAVAAGVATSAGAPPPSTVSSAPAAAAAGQVSVPPRAVLSAEASPERSEVGAGVFVVAALWGLEPSTEGGLHVHAGTSCATHAQVGGHYFEGLAADPWSTVAWATDAAGAATFEGPDMLDFSLRGGDRSLEGRALVVRRANSCFPWLPPPFF
jgi:hypothetical protein